MIPPIDFMLLQLARFKAMKSEQILAACGGRIGRSNVYRVLSILCRDGYVSTLLSQAGRRSPVYFATPQAARDRRALDEERLSITRLREQPHTLKVVDVMLELSRYSNVTGLATEHELTIADLSKLVCGRRPDGILQITQGEFTFEVAVEVEMSRKPIIEIKKILECYLKTFEQKLLCRAVVIVACDSSIADTYTSALTDMPMEQSKKVLIVHQSNLVNMKETYFGTRGQHAGECGENVRSVSANGVQYNPFESTSYDKQKEPMGSDMNPQ